MLSILNYLPDKQVICFPAIPYEDYALWLKLYKNEILINCYTFTEPLAEYNVTPNNLSANKLKLEFDLWKQHVKPECEDEFIFKGRFGSYL